MQVTVTIDIDAGRHDVWAALEQIERHVEWMADAASIRFENDQRRGVGTEFVCATRFGPLRTLDRMTVTTWQPPERIGVRHDGLVSGVGVFRLESVDLARRTRFTWSETLSLPWYFGGRIAEPLAARLVMAPLWRRNLARFRSIVESGSPTA